MSTTEYRPLILHVSHGAVTGSIGTPTASGERAADLSLHTSVEALADGLLAMYRTDATAAQVLGEVLARLAGVTEYTAVLGTDAERWNALLAEQMERVATLTRERDEARADLDWADTQRAMEAGVPQRTDAIRFRGPFEYTTPTQGEKA